MNNRDKLLVIGGKDLKVFSGPEYDDAIIGVSTEGNVIYSYYRMIDLLVKRDAMTPDDAADFILVNTVRALPYAGEGAPIVMYDLDYVDVTPVDLDSAQYAINGEKLDERNKGDEG